METTLRFFTILEAEFYDGTLHRKFIHYEFWQALCLNFEFSAPTTNETCLQLSF